MSYLFTSESVSEGHPDKVSDQISDALIDNFLAFDKNSKVACETLVTTGQVILAGEVKSNTYLDVQQIARDVVNKIGSNNSLVNVWRLFVDCWQNSARITIEHILTFCISNFINYVSSYLFTSESVSEGHPDKVSDQISDALIDNLCLCLCLCLC